MNYPVVLRSATLVLALAVLPRAALGQVDTGTGAPGPAPEVPSVQMPQLLHYESASYPEEAARAGLEGAVVLRLLVDIEGNVTEAEVVGPAGHGFDEAAREAALKFKWEPALRDGKPIPVRIDYEYRFTLEPASEPTTAKEGDGQPNAPAPGVLDTGNLSGRLSISGTDIGIAGAEVVVEGPEGGTRQLSTDANGSWNLSALSPGTYTVRVSAPGYQSTVNVEQVVAGEVVEVVYRLAPEVEGIEVTVQGERPPREVTRRTIEQREIARVPGTGGDALRAIEALPGVARPPFLAGLLVIRGSDPNDSLAFIDGSGVPLIYHFGGLFSVVPTEVIDRFDLYPGNFSARYGRYMGGLVDVALRSPNTECYEDNMQPGEGDGCYHGLVEADLLNTRFLFEGPVPGLKKWSFLVAGRRSWFDTWLKPVLEEAGAGVTAAPVYWDYQIIVETKPRPDSRLSIRGFGSDDGLELLINDPLAQDPGFGGNLEFGTAFHTAQVLYEDQLNSDVKLSTMATIGRTTLDFSVGTFLFRLDWVPVEYRSEFSWSLGERFTLNSGLDFLMGTANVVVRAPPPPDPGEPDPGPFSTRPPIETEVKTTAFRPGWYVEGEATPTDRLRIVPGFRVDYARDTSHADVSPRLNARYDIVSSVLDSRGAQPARRTTVKGGAGYFHQPPEFQETTEAFGTPNLRSNRALHYALGIEQELTEHVEASVEGFYKDLTNLVSRGPNDDGTYTYNNDGTGHIVGVETFLKYKPDARFFGWLAYTLSRSVRQAGPDEPERLFEYDQTHNLSVLGSYRLGRGWEFGARFRLTSGNLYTPVLQPPALAALYAADAGSYAPLQDELYSRRLPLFHQLDVRVDKRWQFRTYRIAAYLDVRNAYNNAAVEGVSYSYDYSESVRSSGIPILPSLGLRGEF